MLVSEIEPYVVKVETFQGWGTGFLFYRGRYGLGIATAHHVVDRAQDWDQPIKVRCHKSEPVLLDSSKRTILTNPESDAACIVVSTSNTEGLDLPAEAVRLFAADEKLLKPGVAVGWVGFPSVHDSLCFFSGHVSAFDQDRNRYLLDGVAIGGVSGGPVFYNGPDGLTVMGSVSAYSRGNATELGLCIASEVHSLLKMAKGLRSIEQKVAAKETSTPKATGTPKA